jgi:hypothetical protein
MAAALKVADRIVSRWAAGDDPPSSVWIELASILEARADDVEVREVERCRRLASVAKAAAQLEDIEDPKELNKLFRSNDTPGWQMRVAGLVSRIFPNGARVAVPMGTYEMRELSIDRYELTRREGPTFTLSTLEVSTYVGSGAWFRSAAGGCKAAKCRDRSNRWGGLPPSSPCTLIAAIAAAQHQPRLSTTSHPPRCSIGSSASRDGGPRLPELQHCYAQSRAGGGLARSVQPPR